MGRNEIKCKIGKLDEEPPEDRSKWINLCVEILKELGCKIIGFEIELDILCKLRFDILFIYNGKHFLLEYDGRQHYDKKAFNQSKEDFENSQNRDRSKDEIVSLLGGTLLRISDKNRDNIRNFIEKVINSNYDGIFKDNDINYKYLEKKASINVIKSYCPKYEEIKTNTEFKQGNEQRCQAICNSGKNKNNQCTNKPKEIYNNKLLCGIHINQRKKNMLKKD